MNFSLPSRQEASSTMNFSLPSRRVPQASSRHRQEASSTMHTSLPSTRVPQASSRQEASSTMNFSLPSRRVPQASSRQEASSRMNFSLPSRRVRQALSRQEASSTMHFSLPSRRVPQASCRQEASSTIHFSLPSRRVPQASIRQEASSTRHFSLPSRRVRQASSRRVLRASSRQEATLHFSLPSRAIRCSTAEEVEAEKELIEEDAMERMDKTLETVRGNFNTVRTGRASPSLLDRVEVEYYGTQVSLKSIAQISTLDGSTILVAPFDKSSLAAIEKAISKSDVGLSPNNDGNVIRLNIPQLTSDRRKELLKLVSRLTEDGKVAIRNVRRDAIKAFEKLEKDKKLSEDNMKDATDEIQKLTDDYVKKIDALFKQKEKELSTV